MLTQTPECAICFDEEGSYNCVRRTHQPYFPYIWRNVPMTLIDYQEKAKTFAVYPGKNLKVNGLIYTVLALCGEAGELANKLKKVLRRGDEPDYVDKAVLMDELSDVLWYVASTATELGYTLEQVAAFNIAKLEERKRKDKITG